MEKPEIRIIAFEEKYFSKLVELIHSTVSKYYPKVYPKEVVNFFLDYHSEVETRKKIKNRRTFQYLAIRDGELVACGYLNKKEVGGVYVKPGCHRLGIGKLIVEHILQKARSLKHDHVWLDSTLSAKEFYLSMGFTLVENMTELVENDVELNYYRMFMKL